MVRGRIYEENEKPASLGRYTVYMLLERRKREVRDDSHGGLGAEETLQTALNSAIDAAQDTCRGFAGDLQGFTGGDEWGRMGPNWVRMPLATNEKLTFRQVITPRHITNRKALINCRRSIPSSKPSISDSFSSESFFKSSKHITPQI